jgi:hypothetical protein
MDKMPTSNPNHVVNDKTKDQESDQDQQTLSKWEKRQSKKMMYQGKRSESSTVKHSKQRSKARDAKIMNQNYYLHGDD